jgi:hypothetical protein
MGRVQPSEKLHKQIHQILCSNELENEDLLGFMLEISVKMLLQKVLEQEAKNYL